jgi:hypothetical protein
MSYLLFASRTVLRYLKRPMLGIAAGGNTCRREYFSPEQDIFSGLGSQSIAPNLSGGMKDETL